MTKRFKVTMEVEVRSEELPAEWLDPLVEMIFTDFEVNDCGTSLIVRTIEVKDLQENTGTPLTRG